MLPEILYIPYMNTTPATIMLVSKTDVTVKQGEKQAIVNSLENGNIEMRY